MNYLHSCLALLSLALIFHSCNGQGNSVSENTPPLAPPVEVNNGLPDWLNDTTQISHYVRRIFQDSKGDLWFGSNQFGAMRHDGKALEYFSTPQGMGGSQITGIMEDRKGRLWFSTDGGITVYDGSTFRNYGKEAGLEDTWAWAVFEDSKDQVWAGSNSGLYQLKGEKFVPFPYPLPQISNPSPRFSEKGIRCITEDRDGNIWFGMDGMGACKWDGKAFSYLNKENGLCDNSVACILQDRKGNLWFSTMFGGVCRYDGKEFMTLSEGSGIGNNECWSLYEDRDGGIWFPSEGYGLYRYTDSELKNYAKNEGMRMGAPQCVFQDREGRIWAGGGGGLYRLDGDRFVNVTKRGPWR